MSDITPEPQLNRAGRRAQARTSRSRRAGAVMAAIPAAFGTTALLLGATAMPAGAADLVVTNLDPTGAGSLHDVAEAANDGDVITFQAGLTGTITLDDEINIDTSVTIQGPGAGVITVSGGNTDRIFHLDGPSNSTRIDVVISGLTLTQGSSGFGSAILFDDANVTVRDAVLTDNASTGGGGAIATDDSDEDLVIDNTEITGNSADGNGGGVYFYSSDGGTFTMTGSTVSGNDATDDGGGLWIKGEDDNETGAVIITGSTITENTAYEGGGVFAYYLGSLAISTTTISRNVATDEGGGGLFVSDVLGSTSISGSTISDNSGDYGGGVYFTDLDDAATTIEFTTIAGNTAGAAGGGIEWYENDGELVIRNSTLSGNTSGTNGGGLYVSSSNYGAIVIQNSTISGNTAGGEGGAISFEGYYGLEIVQSTIAGNTADTVGGIWIYDRSLDNSAGSADAEKDARKAAEAEAKAAAKAERMIAKGKDAPAPQVLQDRVRPQAIDPVVVNGSIISQNSGADVGNMGVLEASGSLLGTIVGTTLVDQGGNLFGVDPLLGPLQDNGGPTRTHALLDGSPAINTGPDPVADFPGNADDQRGPGYPRVIGGRVDIGAFEVQPTTIEPNFTG